MARKYEALKYYYNYIDSKFIDSSKNIKECFPNYKDELFVIYALLKEFYGCNYPEGKPTELKK
ncbi:hypothetical protein MBIO_0683 [Mycoplasmopsis fermentans PG18]|uniref:Uncharacterized protein n=2 Tax=Mycoplasmopsis fermentans TaxID=2115 RepID=C4XFM6_MYCFP|nr:hypothetical protein MBIO_0683 [Mycoplasmopsis fermentans PG18]